MRICWRHVGGVLAACSRRECLLFPNCREQSLLPTFLVNAERGGGRGGGGSGRFAPSQWPFRTGAIVRRADNQP
ncbi:hypothetical protein POVWA1_008730 [Plasmodium ovale wallikeri]|uniref:Uncharacterized protein n=1 Tax=Plasmodium ovale wallikeri TaxID=864142 RepID=A0A1A8YK76_PLAOA|nr:hypothetical protein POVWA1_008730 [Plasmodium ovale wallikeri]